MKSFNIDDYKEYFKKETMEIVRWDEFSYGSISAMFSQEPLKAAAQSLLKHVKEISKEELEKLDKDLQFRPRQVEADRKYRLYDILDFLSTFFDHELIGNNDVFKYMMDQNEARLGQQYYKEPYWVLARQFFIDTLGALEAWAFKNSEEGREYEKEIEKMIAKMFPLPNE